MRNRKKFMAIFAAVLMTMSLGACARNRSTDTSSTNTDAEADVEAETAENSEEPVTISIAWWGGQDRNEYTQELLDLYSEEHPNVTFEASPSGWDGYFDKIATQAASGALPDIVQMDYSYLTTYANNKSIADLQDFIDDGTIDVSNIDSTLYESGRIDVKLTGIVCGYNVLAMGYNPDVLAEAEVTEPTADWTWSEFIDICMTVAEKTGKYGIGIIPADDTNIFSYWVRQHGESLFSTDNQSLGYSDDQVYIDFVTMCKELIDAGAMPNPDEYDAIVALGSDSGPVVTGDAALTIDWSNYAVRVEANNDTIKMVTPPLSDTTDNLGLWVKPGMFFSVAETSNVKQEAAEFIDWFVNSEEANDLILGERGTPVSSDIREYLKTTEKLTKQQSVMFDNVEEAIDYCGSSITPDPAGISEVTEAFKTSFYSVLYEQSNAEDAAASFRESANEILARNN